MVASAKRKTSLTLDAETLEAACAQRRKWLTENTEAFAAQSDWHECHGHPLADIMTAPGGTLWAP